MSFHPHKYSKFLTYIALSFSALSLKAQLTPCQNGIVYMHTSPIQAYNPALPLSASNPISTGISAGGTGLAYGPNINGTTPNPTFYTTISNVYYYWNGSAWVSTGHTTGTTSAVNIGVGPGCLYNLIGSSGQIWQYNGTGNGTLLTTVTGFSSGGPYDLVVDDCCNLYILKTTTTPYLRVYSPTGALLASCTISGMPSLTAGGGFAIIGNQVIVSNGGGLWLGNLGGTNITFTNVSTNSYGAGDFASCPITCGSFCYTVLPIEFKSFFCEAYGTYTRLNWSTSVEENISEFVVERSDDAVNFQVISHVLPNEKASDYIYEDATVSQNTIYYYRITAIEKNNQTNSTTICEAVPGRSQVTSSGVFPNPSSNEFSVFVHSRKDDEITIRIIDPLGKIAKTINQNIKTGSEKLNIIVSDLPEGIYFFELRDGNSQLITTQKLSVNRK